jgi:hypothetical protein
MDVRSVPVAEELIAGTYIHEDIKAIGGGKSWPESLPLPLKIADPMSDEDRVKRMIKLLLTGTLTLVPKSGDCGPHGVTKADVDDLNAMSRIADFFGIDQLIDLASPRKVDHHSGAMTSDAWFQLALGRAWPEMHVARQTEAEARMDPDLSVYSASFQVEKYLLDLSNLAPVSPERGAERVDRTLLAAPLSGEAKTWTLPQPMYFHHPLLDSETRLGQPVLKSEDAWESVLPACLVECLQRLHEGRDGGYVVIAGGAALNTVIAGEQAPPSDYDLFACATDAANAQTLLDLVVEALKPVSVKISAHAVTMKLSRSRPLTVQVVLRVYASPAHVVLGFDVQVCKIALWAGRNGQLRAAASPTAVEALRRGAIVADFALQSTTFALRLDKYAKKGFRVVVPLLFKETVSVEALTGSSGGLIPIVQMFHNIKGDRGQRLRRNMAKADKHERQNNGPWTSDYDDCGNVFTLRLDSGETSSSQGFLSALTENLALLLGRWRQRRAPLRLTLKWMVEDVMRQGPVRGSFHPTNDYPYNLYSDKLGLNTLLLLWSLDD